MTYKMNIHDNNRETRDGHYHKALLPIYKWHYDDFVRLHMTKWRFMWGNAFLRMNRHLVVNETRNNEWHIVVLPPHQHPTINENNRRWLSRVIRFALFFALLLVWNCENDTHMKLVFYNILQLVISYILK